MHRGLGGALGAVLMLVARGASAQNADPFFFGDEAALASGSVVASGRDSGALWYNPAGFGGLQRGLVSASASTFGLRFRKVPDALRVITGGKTISTNISSADVISLPNAVVAATQIGDRFALAGGLLTTQRDIRSAFVARPDEPASAANGAPITIGQRLDITADRSKYHLGGAFAAELSKQLRLGTALFLTYAKSTQSVQYAFTLNDNAKGSTEPHAFVTANQRVTTSALGLGATFGGQLEVSPTVSLGLTLRTPELALSQSSDGGQVIATGTAGTGTTPAAVLEASDAGAGSAGGKVVVPGRVLAGIAFALGPPQSWLEVGVDAAHGLPKTSVLDAQRPTINARVGVRYMLSPSWVLGGGLFSDRAVLAKPGEFIGAEKVDYYGLTAGVSKRTPLSLAQNPSPEALVLVTTFSLRTAIGFGETRPVVIDIDDNNRSHDLDRSKVTFFELMPYLGSAVVF